MDNSQDSPLTYQEYRDGMDKLYNTEGWQIAEKIKHLGVSAYIFKTNHDELIGSIEYFKSSEAMLLWDVRNHARIEHFLKEITRQLHNFVASAKTLVEHTRIIAREMYEDTDFWSEYDSQVTRRFKSNPLVQFAHKLRDYILHRDFPVTFASLSFEHDSSFKISIKDLRGWDGWTGLSRQYVNSANDDEKIEEIIRTYTNTVVSFHNWFNDRQAELHKDAFKEAEELRQRLINSKWHLKM